MLQIDPNTEKGKTQLEAIGWAQDQINKILELYFNSEYKVQRGLRVEFRMNPELQFEKIKVDVLSLDPKTEEELKQAVEQVTAQFRSSTNIPDLDKVIVEKEKK